MSRRRVLAVLALATAGVLVAGHPGSSALALGIFLLAVAGVDRRALRPLARPGFWVVSVLIGLGSAFLLGGRGDRLLGLPLSAEGLLRGVLMVERGTFLVALASWASRSVSRPGIERAAARLGLPGLGLALSDAFDLLPRFAERVRRVRQEARGRREWLAPAVDLVVEAARAAEDLATRPASRP